MLMNHQEQLDALASLVDDWAIKKDRRVKGEFTSVDFVTFKLNQIFTPGGWSFTILDGPNLVTIKESAAYTLLTGRLSVCFADGSKAHQDDVGIWPLVATGAREGKPLTDTAPERYETVLKAARTDCLKNAARNLGTCFAPLSDLELVAAKKRADYEYAYGPIKESAEESTAVLFGDDPANGLGSKSGGASLPEKPLGPEPVGDAPKPARDVAAIVTFGDCWLACQEDFGLNRTQALKELGITKQEDLDPGREPREFYLEIAEVREGRGEREGQV